MSFLPYTLLILCAAIMVGNEPLFRFTRLGCRLTRTAKSIIYTVAFVCITPLVVIILSSQ